MVCGKKGPFFRLLLDYSVRDRVVKLTSPPRQENHALAGSGRISSDCVECYHEIV